jgi:hypothetical protein
MDRQLTLSSDGSHEHQLVLLPKDRNFSEQRPQRIFTHIEDLAITNEYSAALRVHEEKVHELSKIAFELNKDYQKAKEEYLDWQSAAALELQDRDSFKNPVLRHLLARDKHEKALTEI